MTIVCDLDDTLVHKGVIPNTRVIAKVNQMPGPIVIVTGRQESERAKTEQTLKSIGVNYTKLLMNTGTPDKQGQLASKRANISGLPNVTLVIDNDAVDLKLYKTMGLKTLRPQDM